MWIQNHIQIKTLWSVRKIRKTTILLKLGGLHFLKLFTPKRMIRFRERQRVNNHRFINNWQEHFINDVLKIDWKY